MGWVKASLILCELFVITLRFSNWLHGVDKQVIRSYHGHLSGVYCLSLHPTLDVLLTGGRDSVCRVSSRTQL